MGEEMMVVVDFSAPVFVTDVDMKNRCQYGLETQCVHLRRVSAGWLCVKGTLLEYPNLCETKFWKSHCADAPLPKVV